jgi:hypothetical protein
MGTKLFDPGSDTAVTTSRGQNGMTLQQRDGIESQQQEKYPKATFYLPNALLERLDKLWISRRNRDRRVKKSDLVREALETYITEQTKRKPRVSEDERGEREEPS